MIEAIIRLSLLRLLLVRRKDTLLVEAIICLSLLSFFLVRRKVALLIEVAAAVIVLNWECRYIMRGQTKGMVRQFAEDG